jgi:hypothetical protein
MVDSISRLATALRSPYVAKAKAAAKRNSALTLVRLILNCGEDLLLAHKRKVLKDVVWIVTEADGKHRTRYRSKRVVDTAEKNPNSTELVQHEHVVGRSLIADRLIQYPDQAKQILNSAVACIVMRDEHIRLNDEVEGWRRYLEAEGGSIEVYDMKEPRQLIDLEQAVADWDREFGLNDN